MFEVTGLEIGQLRDDDLRSLVGLLCEAELKLWDLPIVGVTWGGHQDAADGGIDVRVNSEFDIKGSGFLTKGKTAFQVKKPDMQKGKIKSEMRPKDVLRKPIIDLAKEKGAYIIVSSNCSATDSALAERIDAMNEAIHDLEEKDYLTLDFYDQNRMATWVNFHPGLIVWVKEKIGTHTFGWQPFKDWSKRSYKTGKEYLVNEETRIFEGTSLTSSGMSTIEGINKIRQTLSKPKSSIRIVGLSGVGKTRLLQSLFDERLGKNALNPYQVIYGDVSDELVPPPTNFAQRLVLLKKPLVLIVDNCPPKLHRSLTSICSSEESQISLITVEYDIKEDQPEETIVYRIERISDSLIKKIVHLEFPYINYETARKIAEFSGGNARIAYALAGTIKSGETISYLKDSELFERLFLQRNTDSTSLMATAEVCSLVYSFDCRTTEGNDSEMKILSSLIGLNKQELHKGIAELKRRNLVQQRTYWYAILPHAIANRLASTALENIPFEKILKTFESNGDRLLRSFSNRISYLHQNRFAEKVAERWFSDVGLLKDLVNLNGLEVTLFRNIAPINPVATLTAIERTVEGREKEILSNSNRDIEDFAIALVIVAYDTEYFSRCVRILAKFYKVISEKKLKQKIELWLKSLCYIKYSKTHAPLQNRLDVIKELVISNEEENKTLGFLMLEASLQTTQFNSQSWFNNYKVKYYDKGYSPKNKEELVDWYTSVLKFCERQIHQGEDLEYRTKKILANCFRLLWRDVGKHQFYGKLYNCFSKIGKISQWNEGWISVKSTIRYESEKTPPDALEKLNSLAKELAPKKLIDKVRSYVFSNDAALAGLMGVDILDPKEERKNVERKVINLGFEVAKNIEVFTQLKGEMVVSNRSWISKLFPFGEGLASTNNITSEIWDGLIEEYKSAKVENHNYRILFGYLHGLSKSNWNLLNQLLDDALEDEFLVTKFPSLQSQVKINNEGYERLLQSLHDGKTPINEYINLSRGIRTVSIANNQLAELLERIILKDNGINVAFEILSMESHDLWNANGHRFNDRLKSFGRKLLLNFTIEKDFSFRINPRNIGYKMSRIISFCFNGVEAKNDAKELCINIRKAFNEYYSTSGLADYLDALTKLAERQPYSFLEGILGNFEIEDDEIHHDLDWIGDQNPFSAIEDSLIMDWCKEEPSNRYTKIAFSVDLYQESIDEAQLKLSQIAKLILAEAPDLTSVLKAFSRKLIPSMWSGARSDFLGKRLPILNSLTDNVNSVISNWAMEQKENIEREINRSQEEDFIQYNRIEERFE